MRYKARSGFTLLEMVITLAVALILTTVGIGMSDDLIPRYRTRKAAVTMAGHMQQCRALAVRTGRECSLWLIDYDDALTDPDDNIGEYWIGLGNLPLDSSCWDYLPVDTHGRDECPSDDVTWEGIIDLSDDENPYYSRRVSLAEWATINGPGSGNSNRIVFNSRGFVSNPVADFNSSGHIEFSFVNKMAGAKGITETCDVILTRSGMTRVDSSAQNRFDGQSSGTVTSTTEPE